MEYIYGAMLLHSAGKEVDKKSLKKVVEATGEDADEAKVKALTASLEDVDIEKAISEAAAAPAAAPAAEAAPAEGGKEKEGKEEKKEKSEEEKKEEEEAASEGIGSLFG